MDIRFINVGNWRDNPRAGRAVRWVLRQPGWVWGIAALVAGFVLLWPLIAAVLTAGLIFILLFAFLSLANWVGTSIRAWFDGGDGRRNVRVVGAENGA